VQTTLLAAGIAIILALVTALVGPFFVPWSDYRTLFEAQASKALGVPVQISGAIDARLLPVPSVRLRQVTLKPAAQDAPSVNADEVDMAFALGNLLRGEWRATELRIAGAEATLRLDERGRIAWPQTAAGGDPDRFVIDRLSLEGSRIRLHDAGAPGAGRTLEEIWFTGDARSLAGPLKGEGGFRVGGAPHAFRITMGRVEQGAARLRLSFDPGERLLSLEADGTIRLDEGVPRFEGAARVARLPGVIVTGGRAIDSEPWTLTSQVQASPAAVLFERLDLQYGDEQRALKLSGTADLKLGARPRLDAVVSAGQLDLDRLVALPEETRRLPLVATRAALSRLGEALLPDIPVRLGFSVEALTLAGAGVQTLRGDLVADGQGWRLEGLEFRAPGFTQVRASGSWAEQPEGTSFVGPVSIEAVDPRTLAAWLEGRSLTVAAQGPPIGPLRASGVFTLAPGSVAVEQLKAAIDRKEVAGRLAYRWGGAGQPPKLDAALSASELDVDAAMRAVRAALPGLITDVPADISLALNLGLARIQGIEAGGVDARLAIDEKGLAFERLAVADLGGAAVDLKGRIERLWTAPRGKITLDVAGDRLDGVIAIVARASPRAAEVLRGASPLLGPARLRATIDVDTPAQAQKPESVARARIAGKAGATQVTLETTLAGDPAKWWSARAEAQGRIEAADGGALLRLLRLETAIEAKPGSGVLTLSAKGPLDGDLSVDARLAASGIEAGGRGTLKLAADGPAGKGEFSLTAEDLAAARPLIGQVLRAIPARLKTGVTFGPDRVAFEALSGSVGGAAVNGRLVLGLGEARRLDGRIEVDAIDVPTLAAALLGVPQAAAVTRSQAGSAAKRTVWPTQPFAPGVLAGLSGQVELGALRAVLPGDLEIRQLRAFVRFDDSETAIEDVSGVLADGRLVANFVFPRGAGGTSADLRLALSNADIAALLPASARAPASGRVSFQIEAKGAGRSAASLVGALSGAGTVSLQKLALTGFDPQIFESAKQAVDKGVDIEPARIAKIVNAALDQGGLRVEHADGALTLTAGQMRVAGLLAKGDRADLGVMGHLDLVHWLLDARLSLMGRPGSDAPAAGRPEIFVALRGDPTKAERSVDTSALVGWLTLRAVDLQAKRLQALEAERRALEAEMAALAEREREREKAREREEKARERERALQETKPAVSPARVTPSSLPLPPVMAPEDTGPPAPAAAPVPPTRTPRDTKTGSPPVPVSGPAGGTQRDAAPRSGAASANKQPEATSELAPPELAPPLPPPINIVPAPQPRQPAGREAGTAPRQRPANDTMRLPPPPTAAPARTMRLFDLFGAAR